MRKDYLFSVIRLYLCAILFFVFLQNSTAQPFSYQPNFNQNPKTLNSANSYEVIVKQELAKFFSPGTFVVDINILQGSIEVIKPSNKANIKKKMGRLPGMPVLPKSIEETTPTDTNSNYIFSIEEVDYLDVSVLVDTTFNDTDLDFIKSLVRSVIPIDETKGDIVKVKRAVFPKAQESNQVITAPIPLQSKPEAIQYPNNNTPNTENKSADTEKPEQNILLYALLFILLICLVIIVFVVFLLYRRSKQNNNNNSNNNNDVQKEEKKSNKDDELSIVYPREELKSSPQTEDIINYEFNRQHVITSVISNPKDVAAMLEAWMLTNPEEGKLRAANALNAVNPKLLNFIKPHLSDKVYTELSQAINNGQLNSYTDKYQEARDFSKELLSINTEHEKNEDLFEFLNQITDAQVIHMLKDEDDNLSSILLAQLNSKRSKNILGMLDINRRSSIIMKMSKIDLISSSIYREVAGYFSKKAVEVKGMQNVAFDGLQTILDILDQMQDEDQDQLIGSIASQDLELANNIKQQFVGFKNLVYLTDVQLEAALRDIDTDTIVAALTGSTAAIQNKVIAQRAVREQTLIRSELDGSNTISPELRDASKKKIIDSIRKVLKTIA